MGGELLRCDDCGKLQPARVTGSGDLVPTNGTCEGCGGRQFTQVLLDSPHSTHA